MTHLAPENLQPGLLRVLHRAFVEARNLALKGDSQRLYELADTFELLPELMVRWEDSTLERIRSILTDYETSHCESGYEYVSLLEGDSASVSPS
jgi:hypothetical protein